MKFKSILPVLICMTLVSSCGGGSIKNALDSHNVSGEPVDISGLNIARKEIELTDVTGKTVDVELSVWTDKKVYNAGDNIEYDFSIKNKTDNEIIFSVSGCGYFEFFSIGSLEQGDAPPTDGGDGGGGYQCQAIYMFGLMPNDSRLYEATNDNGKFQIIKPLHEITIDISNIPISPANYQGKFQMIFGIRGGIANGKYISVDYEVR